MADIPSAPPWYHRAVFYQVYPRSFADGNGDGIGDLPGIIARLDYLRDLGIDALWLSPHYPSPQVECGYDIADCCAVNPEYGTLADFQHLLDEAHLPGHSTCLVLLNFSENAHHLDLSSLAPASTLAHCIFSTHHQPAIQYPLNTFTLSPFEPFFATLHSTTRPTNYPTT